MLTAEKLKASILQEAIQGRLVPQLPEELAIEIQSPKINEVPFKTPQKWQWIFLGQAVEIVSARRVHQSDWRSQGIPFYRAREIAALSEGRVINSALFIDESLFQKLSSSGCPEPGDVMITAVGTLGKCYIVRNREKFYYKDASVLCLKNKGIYFPKFLKLLFESSFMRQQIQSFSSGTTVGTITIKNANNFIVPLPPLAEQKRIVAKIDELLTIIEQYGKAQTSLDALERTLPEKLFASILQEAIQGRLVPQLEEEPSVSIDNNEVITGPFEIPTKWRWVRLSFCTDINPRISVDDETEVSFVPMPLLEGGYKNKIDLSNIRKWKDVKKGFTRFEDGDIVVAKITPCFQNRKSAIVNNAKNGIGAGTTELNVFRCLDMVYVEYVLWFFKTNYFINYGVRKFKGTAGQQRISSSELKECAFPLPPLAEQKRIVAKLNEILPIVEQYGNAQRALDTLEQT